MPELTPSIPEAARRIGVTETALRKPARAILATHCCR